ncbi:MAG: LysE family translocator [Actinomycetota bacterium]|nr:LysE family translocator [Actinomycetota bacterium]
MDLFGTLIRGLLIGFSIAAPIGPIGVLCIKRTLAEGRASGFSCGLGAASADAVYGGLAAFGLISISSFLVHYQPWLRLVGGVFLLYLGSKTFLQRPTERETKKDGSSSVLAGVYATTFFLTMTNPLTILSFAAIFAGMGVAETSAGYAAATLVVGVFSGSGLWWLFLSGGVSLFRSKLRTGMLRWVNRASGTIILGFGVIALLNVLTS